MKEMNKRQNHIEDSHKVLLRQHKLIMELEMKQLSGLNSLRDQHTEKQVPYGQVLIISSFICNISNHLILNIII